MLQKQADNHLPYDLLLCQIAPSTPLTLWELFSLLSALLQVSIVHYLHSLQLMYLNVIYSSTVMNTFFGFLHGHCNHTTFFFFSLGISVLWCALNYDPILFHEQRLYLLDMTFALNVFLNTGHVTNVVRVGHLNRREGKGMILSTFLMKPC